MIVKLLTEHHLEFLSLKGGCRDSSESTLVKMSNLLSHATAHFANQPILSCNVGSFVECGEGRGVLMGKKGGSQHRMYAGVL